MPRVFVYIAFVSVLLCFAHAQEETTINVKEEVKEYLEKGVSAKTNAQEELFKRSFVKRRREHLEAVKSLRKVDNYERLYKMVMVLGEKLIEVIESSKVLIENAGFSPRNNSFPEDSNVRDALSTILENTALFGDIILHIPHITHRILRTQQKWNATIHWSLNFTNQTRHLLDKGTLTMIHLVGQELNITEREAGYFNPYWPSSMTSGKGNGDGASKKKKLLRKEKRKKGPQMIKIEL